MSASPARNESHSLSLEYAPRSPSPDAPTFPIAITTKTGVPVSGFATPEIVHAPSPQLAPPSPLPPSPPPLQIPPQTPSNNPHHISATSSHYNQVVQSSQLATKVTA